MHNRVKSNKPTTESEAKALKDKASTYNALVNLVLSKRKQHARDKDTLLVISKLSKLNPDFYSLWNFRREILLDQYPLLQRGIVVTTEKFDNPELLAVELSVTTEAIKRNPKSYCAWFHRLWIAERMVMDFDTELALCAEFLQQDQRNFHCWNYRRALHKISGKSNESEFIFSTEKISENFSNYSAFHHRSKFIESALASAEVCDLFVSELKIVESAIFTEPDDQSAWWYHQYLLAWIMKQPIADTKQQWILSVITSQIQIVEDLLSIEENSRWAMNCIVYMVDFITRNPLLAQYCDKDLTDSFVLRRKELLERLLDIDPNHSNRYKYLLAYAN